MGLLSAATEYVFNKAMVLTLVLSVSNLCAGVDSNDVLKVKEDPTGSDVLALYECIVEELDTREDRSVIYQLLCEINAHSVPVRGGINVYLPSGESFYFEDWNKLGHILSNIVIIEANKSKNPLYSFLSSPELQIQPARLKGIRLPIFSPVTGNRIAQLKIQSISALYKSFGPFKIPSPGYAIKAAELTIYQP